MVINKKNLVLLFTAFTVFSCGEPQNERLEGVALSDKNGTDLLAESLFCSGSTSVLKDASVDTYDELMGWQATFERISSNAKQSAMSFANNDSALVERRLAEIKQQVQQNINRIDAKDNRTGMKNLVKETLAQCTGFAK
jgi:hypothetical protein